MVHMNNYFSVLPEIESNSYRDHLLNEFIPEYSSHLKKTYGYFAQEHLTPKLLELQEVLFQYDFPPIEYFLVFRHAVDQSIHIDGRSFVRYASLNLVLDGYEGTRMNYYDIINDIRNRADAQYFSSTNVRFRESFDPSPNWTLVNSGVPHNIVGINPLIPRKTLGIRFIGNPTYEELALKVQKKWAAE